MAYNTSSSSRKILGIIELKGRKAALTPPGYTPNLDYPFRLISILALLTSPVVGYFTHWWITPAMIASAAFLFGIREIFIQDDHAIVRIYGPLGRLRYLFERELRDKYLQYFNETNTSGRPIPRIVRDYVYQKSKGIKPMSSFGTELDPYDEETTTGCRVLHRNFPGSIGQPGYEVIVGEKRKGVKPFHVRNVVNVSAMSYGSINYKAAESLSVGSRGVAYVNTGEGGYGPHGVAGNDVVFQIGTAKYGVGDAIQQNNGQVTRVLNYQVLKELISNHANIGMIQLKISQGAKPGLGGHLPGDKVTPEIAAVRRIPAHKTSISPSQHAEIQSASSRETVAKLMDFIDSIRKATELPVGLKMCLGNPEEVELLCQAMKKTGKGPDAIQLDGSDGGTGAGPNLFMNYVGYGSAIESCALLHRRLTQLKIRDQVVISVSGRIFTPIHAALAFASGAEIIDSARGPMLALGCIQSLKCHTNHCPTGIATNQPWRVRGLDIPEKSTRVYHFLTGFHQDMMDITRITGHLDPRDIRPSDLRLIRGQYANMEEYFQV
ncbi:MAG: FMN-binding glutamate synthase family protein [Leptospiraceae bacterium]